MGSLCVPSPIAMNEVWNSTSSMVPRTLTRPRRPEILDGIRHHHEGPATLSRASLQRCNEGLVERPLLADHCHTPTIIAMTTSFSSQSPAWIAASFAGTFSWYTEPMSRTTAIPIHSMNPSRAACAQPSTPI